MRKLHHTVVLASLTLGAISFNTPAVAGGFVDIPQDFAANSNEVTHTLWPLVPDSRIVYIEEDEDECIIGVLDIRATADQSRTSVNGINVREVWDREFVDPVEPCDGDTSDMDDWELLETTFDWYAQDTSGNIWYLGEISDAFDHDECEHTVEDTDPPFYMEGCIDGSWEAGFDIWEGIADEDILPGIIMLANPQKGNFYFQEFWEDEATDMGKVLNFVTLETDYHGELDDCIKIKEWVPLSPGEVEHKYYCAGEGLVRVAGVAGGKTTYTEVVDVIYP